MLNEIFKLILTFLNRSFFETQVLFTNWIPYWLGKRYSNFIKPLFIHTFTSYIKRLTKFRNKAVKIIRGGSFRDSPTCFYEYSSLNILKVQDLYKNEQNLLTDFCKMHRQKNFRKRGQNSTIKPPSTLWK